MNKNCLTLSTVASLLVFASSAPAAVVIDNLTIGSQSSSQSLSGPTATTGFFTQLPFPDREVAFSFTTAASATYLTELVFAVSIARPSLDPIEWKISTGTTTPGGTNTRIIGSVAPASSSPTSQILTLTPSTTILLNANTTYWMHITVPTGGALYSFQNTNSQVVEPGWSLGNSWSKDPSNPWNELTSGPQARVRMSVEPIPEPSAVLLGGVGLMAFMHRRRIRKSTTSGR